MSEKCENNKLKVGSNHLHLCLVLFHIPGGSPLQEEAGSRGQVGERREKEFETEASVRAEEPGPVRDLPGQSGRRSC